MTTASDVTPSKPAINRRVARIVWLLCLCGAGLGAVDGFFSFQLADSAPQQGAAAAMGCFYVITPYVLARAFEEVLNARQ